MLKPGMPYFEDEEGVCVPAGFSSVIDAHVHVFPEKISSAVWQWFEHNAWPIRYQLRSDAIIDFLFSRGVDHVVALQYAHKPGIAVQLNEYMADICRKHNSRVTGMATVFPGEENAGSILQKAFDSGLGGLKLHVHVQCFDMNEEYMNPLYECCQVNKKPIVIHAGREPKSSAYNCDPYVLCSIGKVKKILDNFPGLKICVPHLGFDETREYRQLQIKYDNLWLDTAMVLTDYFPGRSKSMLDGFRSDRIMYGSDFPNIPYAWDREMKELLAAGLSPDALEKISYKNAVEFFDITPGADL